MKAIRASATLVLLLAAIAAAGPVTLTWETPTQLEDGSAIPADMLPLVQATVYSVRNGATNWTPLVSGIVANETTVEVPIGVWRFGVTARIGEHGEESDMSEPSGIKAIGKVKKVKGVMVVTINK